ncbi:MAG: diacylglycerol kinase family protein [Clostridiaceae bacterium]|nr:diacylglycerol kinase family protein [Clostridiaceae bacterium]
MESQFKNKTFADSFKNAFNGIRASIHSERNMIVHLLASVLVVLAGIILRIDLVRWISLALVIGLVLISELLNTAIEKLTDMVTGEYSEEAKKIKDIGAAAVLVSAIVSVIVGILIFFRPLKDFFF